MQAPTFPVSSWPCMLMHLEVLAPGDEGFAFCTCTACTAHTRIQGVNLVPQVLGSTPATQVSTAELVLGLGSSDSHPQTLNCMMQVGARTACTSTSISRRSLWRPSCS